MEIARKTAELLEGQGIRCWLAPRDIPTGEDFQNSIVRAIEAMSSMILVFSDAANDSKHVAREVQLADDEGKEVFPVRIGEAKPRGALRYQLSNRQWTDAECGLDGAIEKLAARL